MVEKITKLISKDIYFYGLNSFRIGVFLIPSAFPFSIIFLLTSSIISCIYNKKNYLNDHFNKLVFFVGLLMILSVLIHFYNFSTNNYSELILSKWQPYLSFVGLFNWLPLFWCFFTFQIYLKNKSDREQCAKCFILGVIPVLFSGIGQSFFNWQEPSIFFNGLIIWYQKELDNPPFELSGLFSNANYAGLWLNITLPFCLAYLLKNVNSLLKRNLIFFQILLIIFCIVITNSRAAWGGILLSIILIFGRKSFLFISLGLFILITTITLCIFPIFGEGIQTFFQDIIPNNFWLEFSIQNFDSRDLRIDIWQNSIEIIKKNPIFGIGAATFPILMEGTLKNTVTHSHSLPLEIAIKYGLPTMFLLIGIISSLTFMASKKIYFSGYLYNREEIFDKAWISVLIILIASHFFDIQYFDGRISIASWILVAGTRSFVKENYNP